jgi:hypothetical protein
MRALTWARTMNSYRQPPVPPQTAMKRMRDGSRVSAACTVTPWEQAASGRVPGTTVMLNCGSLKPLDAVQRAICSCAAFSTSDGTCSAGTADKATGVKKNEMQTGNNRTETVTIDLLNMSNTSTMMRHSTWDIAVVTHADAFYCNV